MTGQTNEQRFLGLTKLTDRMLEKASKDQVVEALKIIALEVAHYQAKHGVVHIDEAIALLGTKALSNEQAGWVADSLENVAATLASVPLENNDLDDVLH